MKWLVTTDRNVDRAVLDGALSSRGAHLDEEAPTPLGDEEVWTVEGPRDLDRTLGSAQGVREVYPSSEMTLY